MAASRRGAGGVPAARNMGAAGGGVFGKALDLYGVSIVATVRFGEFALDADTRQVVDRDGEIHLSPKAFEL